MAVYDDFYEHQTEETKLRWQKMQVYIDTAQKQGDAIYSEKPWELTIKIRLPKKGKEKQDGQG